MVSIHWDVKDWGLITPEPHLSDSCAQKAALNGGTSALGGGVLPQLSLAGGPYYFWIFLP